MSLALFAIALAGLAIRNVFASNGETGGGQFTDNLRLFIPMLVGVLCASASGVLSLWSLIRRGARCPLVFAAAGLGCLLLLFAVGDLVAPD